MTYQDAIPAPVSLRAPVPSQTDVEVVIRAIHDGRIATAQLRRLAFAASVELQDREQELTNAL